MVGRYIRAEYFGQKGQIAWKFLNIKTTDREINDDDR